MPELKADLIRMARIPSATFPESALGRIADAFETREPSPPASSRRSSSCVWLLEAYLDPVSGDPLAWQALISAMEAEGPSYSVEELRPRPFAVEFGPRLTEALG